MKKGQAMSSGDGLIDQFLLEAQFIVAYRIDRPASAAPQ